ncbi:MAG: NADH dehydrogenase subunit [Candidatus Aenigmatarchaeota archaeon]|nr:MAG: NADH dehydrogenase subunit [Candidatus Aenigmarchaeota archaeon]
MKEKDVRKCYILPVGPQHPMYVEAENLMVHLDGETIVNVDVNIGYMHRGIEELMQRRNYIQNIYLAERICGICSGIHTVTYCQCIENLIGLEIPERAKYIRTIILELERLHSHFLFFGVMAYEMGLDTVFMYTWKDREAVLDILEMISGNRVNYGMSAVGGVRRDVPENRIPEMIKKLDYLEKRGQYYAKVFYSDKLIRKRSVGLGLLPKKLVDKYSIVGPVARASGVKTDVRKDIPYLVYDKIDWNVIVREEGDVLARIMVKIYEVFESIKILKACLKALPGLEKTLKVKAPFVIETNEAVSVTEAPRGELFYYAVSNGTDKPERLRIRTPSFVNIANSLGILLKGQQLADLPIIVASIDPCFSCCDRVTLIDVKSGERKTVDEAHLKRLEERK